MASIGSFVGCVASFLVCQMFPELWLSPAEATVAACCLCASFIGGTVNFFATANAIGGGKLSALMSSMAAADTFVMAVYFAAMTTALKSKFLARAFRDDTAISARETRHEHDDLDLLPPKKNEEGTSPQTVTTTTTTMACTLKATALVTALALATVKVSTVFEGFMAPVLPGTACAAIAIIAPAIQRLLSKQGNPLIREMQNTARNLSEFSLLLFFAGIGQGAKLGEALLHGPACICFSLLALSVHITIAFTGSAFSKRFCRLPLQLEDVLVASNAAVGGPATAAAFAGRMKSPRQFDLTIAGTAWGVVGYALGTTIGISLHKILRSYAIS